MARCLYLFLFLPAVFLLLLSPSSAVAQATGRVLNVSFEIHGNDLPCKGIAVQLRLRGRNLAVKSVETGFIVPKDLGRLSYSAARKTRVDVAITCNGITTKFPGIYASWFKDDWKVRIDYPPFVQFMHHGTPEKSACVSYLEPQVRVGDPAEIDGYSDPVPGVVERLIAEQPSSTGERARDIAYALAVFRSDYQKNRDYLLQLLNTCLARPRESSEDDVCDEQLLDYLVNLYWRGDTTLLQPLMQIADTRGDVVGSVGTFYADLLERQPTRALGGLQALDTQRQQVVCGLAGREVGDTPQFQRIDRSLGRSSRSGSKVARRCLEQIRALVRPAH